MKIKPQPIDGLNHVALLVTHFDECEAFYTDLLGMRIDWRPDADNVYLTSGKDNLALHRAPKDFVPSEHQNLHHMGFAIKTRKDVDTWFHFMQQKGAVIKAAPKDHRDGTRSFYCADPDGNVVQLIYYPKDEVIESNQ